MKNSKTFLLISLFLCSTASIAMSDKTDESIAMSDKTDEKFKLGEEAHKEHCYKCHGDDIYTRDNSFIKSMDALSKQVVRCKDGNNVPWFDEDTETVIHFVNKKFYKF